MRKMLLLVSLALAFIPGAYASTDSNWGGGGGGFDQLPACNSVYWGVTLFGVQGHNWYCGYNRNYWVIVG